MMGAVLVMVVVVVVVRWNAGGRFDITWILPVIPKKNSVKRWGIQGMILPICLYNYTANLGCSLRTFDLLCLVGC